MNQERQPQSETNRGIAQRTADHNRVLRQTKDPRQAVYVYCAGNQWLMENARAVGNLPPGR